jgi:hypothetical protein
MLKVIEIWFKNPLICVMLRLYYISGIYQRRVEGLIVLTFFIYWFVRRILKEFLIMLREISCKLFNIFPPLSSSAINQRQIVVYLSPTSRIEKCCIHFLFWAVLMKHEMWHINYYTSFLLIIKVRRDIIIVRNVYLALDHQSRLLLPIRSRFNHLCQLPSVACLGLLFNPLIKRLVHQYCLAFQLRPSRIYYWFRLQLSLCYFELFVTFFNSN